MKKFSLELVKETKSLELLDIKKISNSLKRERAVYDLKSNLKDRVNIIAEIKKSSPSHGEFESHITDIMRLGHYIYGGASGISVLAESKFFGGSYLDMRDISSNCPLPVLCKDFIFFEEQVEAAYACGADLVLLIARALNRQEIRKLFHLVKSYGMEPLVELHSKEELELLEDIHPEILMVNMRDLETLEIDFLKGIDVINSIPEGIEVISASGIFCGDDIKYIIDKTSKRNFLIGTSLMTHKNPQQFIRELKNVC